MPHSIEPVMVAATIAVLFDPTPSLNLPALAFQVQDAVTGMEYNDGDNFVTLILWDGRRMQVRVLDSTAVAA
jgi:hypothetical protein